MRETRHIQGLLTTPDITADLVRSPSTEMTKKQLTRATVMSSCPPPIAGLGRTGVHAGIGIQQRNVKQDMRHKGRQEFCGMFWSSNVGKQANATTPPLPTPPSGHPDKFILSEQGKKSRRFRGIPVDPDSEFPPPPESPASGIMSPPNTGGFTNTPPMTAMSGLIPTGTPLGLFPPGTPFSIPEMGFPSPPMTAFTSVELSALQNSSPDSRPSTQVLLQEMKVIFT